jgi:hypothetical protein
VSDDVNYPVGTIEIDCDNDNGNGLGGGTKGWLKYQTYYSKRGRERGIDED